MEARNIPQSQKNTFLPKLRSSRFLRDVLKVTSGTGMAQLLVIGASPVLTRLYSPLEFAIFAMFGTFATVVGVFSTLQLNQAIILAGKDEEAANAMIVSFAACFVGGALAMLLFAAIAIAVGPLFDGTLTLFAMIVSPIGGMLVGSVLILSAMANRHANFGGIARSRAGGAVVTTTVSIALGCLLFDEKGMIIAFLLGQIGTIVVLVLSIRKLPMTNKYPSKVTIFALIKRYYKLPCFSMPSELITVFTQRLPVFILNAASPAAAGFYALTSRVLGMPMQLVSGAVAEVFKRKATVVFKQQGDCRSLVLATSGGLFLASLIPAAIIFLYGESIFAFVFSEKWRAAGMFAQILCPMLLLRFITSPITYMFHVSSKQHEDFLLHLWMLATNSLLWWATDAYKLPEETVLMLFAMNYSFIYAVYGVRSYFLSNPKLDIGTLVQ